MAQFLCKLQKNPVQVPLSTADVQLQTYTADKLMILGKCQVSIEYQNQEVKMDMYVVPGKGPSFLGQDLLQLIKLDWESIA